MNNEFDIQNILEAQIEASMLAGIDPTKIYAIAMTDGLMPAEDNLQQLSENDLEEWSANCSKFKDSMSTVKRLMTVAMKSPDYRPEHEQYVAGAFFASLISGITLGTEIEDYPEEQQSNYDKAIWFYDMIHQYVKQREQSNLKLLN